MRIVISLFVVLSLFTPLSQAAEEKITISNSISLHAEPQYGPNFKHWDYVNPNAPKGGYITLASQGAFDSFNRHGLRGDTPPGIESYIFDSLMVGNGDEDSVLYGLIAEKIEYSEDYSWAIFHINPQATFQDDSPIEASDVAFTFNKIMTEGVPFFNRYYKDTTVEVLDKYRVKFTIANPELPKLISLSSLIVFPEHYFKEKNLSEPFDTPPLGSGPYSIHDYKMGSYVEYKLKDDYWAKDHPTRKGLNNFKYIRYETYLDESVMLEAFKKGEYDFRQENSSQRWATAYNGKNFDKGYIIHQQIPHQIPGETQVFAFNVQRDHFKSREVREAITQMFDYEWTNKNLFYNLYKRNTTYFRNTKYQAKGLPEGKELEILQKVKDELPPEAFTQEFQLPQTKGDGNIRPQMRKAVALLKKAGYQLNKEKKMVHKDTGKALEFEFITYSPASERFVIPFKENLAKIGITMNIKMLDTTRYLNRLRERDYDMLIHALGGGSFPSAGLRNEWHSKYEDSTYNATGVTSKAVDFLVEGIINNQKNEEMLTAYGRAFDRFILWNYYAIPQQYSPDFKIAYWNKFGIPQTRPKLDLGVMAWWIDSEKEKALPKRNAR
ncbi:extracellular solute-binding protein [Teredinibacter sp. KSP-S5-2]|uniref:extracellular solute-binding protein n=1 Tax=Teredinibacter sp. KSP-S5-2 TaxID=3034506 RepID=UPI002934FE1B|nr:extracellular solute-binding protein [Teredinibacter sp. KSP-S5-2]WNO11370.1 extracellular solute-binding protein [Teredinibacter sp. KSP-S5-2]